MNAIQRADKIKLNLQIFSEKTKIDLSQVPSQLDSFIAQHQDFSYSDKRQIKDEKELLSKILVNNSTVFDAVCNSEGTLSKMTRKVLR